METLSNSFTAIILAADRSSDDPLLKAAGVASKSMVPINGIPMVLRVLNVLNSSDTIGARLLCGPSKSIVQLNDELHARISNDEISWIQNEKTPSLSALKAFQSIADTSPILLTTADHALLNTRIVDYFCREAVKLGVDVVAGLASHKVVMSAYPESKRTALKVKDGAFCSCNLFAFLTPQARRAAQFWRQVENQRKNPLRVVRTLGIFSVVRYLLGMLTLNQGIKQLSHKMGIKAGIVLLPFPEAAVDVDTIADWKLVEKLTAGQEN